VRGSRRARYAAGQLQQIDLEVEDVQGRTFRASGRPVNRMAYIPFPNLLTWLYLVRWEAGPHVFYGEEQDVWSLPLWRARDRAARGE
jgi:hypothetical protein